MDQRGLSQADFCFLRDVSSCCVQALNSRFLRSNYDFYSIWLINTLLPVVLALCLAIGYAVQVSQRPLDQLQLRREYIKMVCRCEISRH